MKRLLISAVFFMTLAAPAGAAARYSCPIDDEAAGVYRLAWVDAGRTMRSGAVVVGGDHLADGSPGDATAVTAAYRTLARKYHVGAVVNLRAESAEDEAAAKANGMSYLHLPIADGAAPTPYQVQRFFTFLSTERGHKHVVLWHCAGGIGRTGVLAAMLRLREGWGVKDAAAEMFGMGLTYAQAQEHLPALNAFATALGKKTWYPADWPFAKKSPQDYHTVAKKLALLK